MLARGRFAWPCANSSASKLGTHLESHLNAQKTIWEVDATEKPFAMLLIYAFVRPDASTRGILGYAALMP